MINYEYKKIEDILNNLDKKDHFEELDESTIISTELSKELEKYLKLTKYSVLGIDIYKYSSFPPLAQSLIPFIFKKLRYETNNDILKYDKYLFQKYDKEKMNDLFIDTGDGGFFIFETPLHSVGYAIQFEKNLRSFNSFHFYPKLRNIINELSIRYTITFDDLYKFDNNYYGAGIINNARIISKDKLNRCLLDENSYQWFLKYFNGIESLQRIDDYYISKINIFKSSYKIELLNTEALSTYNKLYKNNIIVYGILNCCIQKIGTIESKGQKVLIYNLHLQYLYALEDETKKGKKANFVLSLGNLNASGIFID